MKEHHKYGLKKKEEELEGDIDTLLDTLIQKS